MQSIIKDMIRIINHKIFILVVTIVTLCSYGFFVVHPMIGVDDSAISRYFIEGLGPAVGRWGYFLLNKILPVAEYTPFITDFLGILLLIIGAVTWCIALERASERKFSNSQSLIFTVIMISSPIFSESLIYYLHNGLGICYILSGCMMIYMIEAAREVGKTKWIKYAKAFLLLCICNGFYESFTIVLLIGLSFCFLVKIMVKKEKVYMKEVVIQFFIAGIFLVLSVVVRTLASDLIVFMFGLGDETSFIYRRSVLSTLSLFQTREGLAEFVMILKKYIAMYYVNAIAYIPIRIYMGAVISMFIIALYHFIKEKSIKVLFFACLMQITPLLLVVIEGRATVYRSSQYIPLYVAFVCFLVIFFMENHPKLKIVTYIIIGIITYNQCYEMTQWFYIDYMKYEDAKNTISQIAYEIEHNYDIEKPVVFVGNYTIPEGIVSKMYVDIESTQYQMIDRILTLLDPNLTSCFIMPNGYSVSSEAIFSVLTWGTIAFEGWDKENHEFFAMHGYSLERIEDVQLVNQIQLEYADLPGFPLQGSIVETKEYIVVKFK